MGGNIITGIVIVLASVLIITVIVSGISMR